MRAFTRALTVCLAAVIVAGCGWQLRGAGMEGLSGRAVAVTAPNGLSTLERVVRRELNALGGRMVAEGAGEQSLELVSENQNRRVLAKDDRGRAEEYELTYRLSYRIGTPGSDTPPRSMVATTDGTYRADGNDALAEQSRRNRLVESLRVEAVRLMLARLAAASPEQGQP
ncbi:LPS-assembly lipoprotein LptE [wastewater metagenome]|uniref:LPS-assembly lipoprotein LptE n=3 Tax=root TaxID=1 RepID=A0A5B8R7X7_9ZZZZ|nr:LPS assembly lipoprotein LptE [Arhodomonas aquaeolei]QEA05229.1 LPS-assembly lipoprotein LptE [uncultured organism]